MGLFDRLRGKPAAPDAASADVTALVARLSDRDPKVRLEACRSLARLGKRAESAVPALMGLIDDDDGDVCNAAASALSEIERNLS